jgi:hypothetical protein
MCGMGALTIEARTLPIAHGLYNALSEYHPELSGDSDDYRVTVELVNDDRRTAGVLDAIQTHVTARDDGPTRVEVEGHRYMFHARGSG